MAASGKAVGGAVVAGLASSLIVVALGLSLSAAATRSAEVRVDAGAQWLPALFLSSTSGRGMMGGSRQTGAVRGV